MPSSPCHVFVPTSAGCKLEKFLIRSFMCALLERVTKAPRDEMIVLGRVLRIVVYVSILVVLCKAPTSVEYTQPTSCSSSQFYQISNLSCVDCATNLTKANNGICLLFIRLFYRCVFIRVKFLFTTIAW